MSTPIIDFKGNSRDVLIYAFRYALGRSSYSTSTVSELIIANWDVLPEGDKSLYKREIQEAIDESRYGMNMDKVNWERILAL